MATESPADPAGQPNDSNPPAAGIGAAAGAEASAPASALVATAAAVATPAHEPGHPGPSGSVGTPAAPMALLPPEAEGITALASQHHHHHHQPGGLPDESNPSIAPGVAAATLNRESHAVVPAGFGPEGLAIDVNQPATFSGNNEDDDIDDNSVDDDDEDDMMLEVDDSIRDFDSALGDDMSLVSSTGSLISSVLKAHEENGRKYHGYKDGKYVLPIDAPELDRQNFQYELVLLTFDRVLNFAPLSKVHRVLDIGCGTGLWVCDFADKHPEAEVIGVDISPIQPAYIPPNAFFEIDDVEDVWSYSYPFDYVHSLMMTGAFRDWPRFHGQAFENLNPGGYLELQDIDFPLKCDDGSVSAGSNIRRWSDLMMEAGRRSGFLLDTAGRAEEMMRDAGFVDIVRRRFHWPVGVWPLGRKNKEVGLYTRENFADGVETICLALFTRFLGWTQESVTEFANLVRNDFRDPSMHAYFDIWVTYGRKPN